MKVISKSRVARICAIIVIAMAIGACTDDAPSRDGELIQIQYSADNTAWHDTFIQGDTYLRFRLGESTWSAGILFVGADGDPGKDGVDGAPGADGDPGRDGESVQIQYSVNNSTWHDTLIQGDVYIRFRVGATGTWTQGVRFALPLPTATIWTERTTSGTTDHLRDIHYANSTWVAVGENGEIRTSPDRHHMDRADKRD